MELILEAYCVRTRLTCVVTILHLLILCNLYRAEETCNSPTMYLNQSTNECMPCTNCEDSGLLVYRNCTSNSDSVCYLECPVNHFYNNLTGECSNCTTCMTTSIDVPCNAVEDTECHTCAEDEFYNESLGRCSIDCDKCPHGCVSDLSRCACGSTEYFSQSLQTCVNCTICSVYDNLYAFRECTATEDAVCHQRCPTNHFYHSESRECRVCGNCTSSAKAQCTATTNTQCCHPNEFFNTATRDCTPDCSKCPLGRCKVDSLYQCICKPCQTGALCDLFDPDCETPTPTDTSPVTPIIRSTESNSDDTISPVTSALIALGAVIGIILFSALFVLLGMFSSCHKGSSNSMNDSSSNNSSERILDDTKASSLLILMSKDNHMTYSEYKASMDFLKLSASGRSLSTISSGSGSSSPRISPKSTRSVRTCGKHRDNNKDWSPV